MTQVVTGDTFLLGGNYHFLVQLALHVIKTEKRFRVYPRPLLVTQLAHVEVLQAEIHKLLQAENLALFFKSSMKELLIALMSLLKVHPCLVINVSGQSMFFIPVFYYECRL